MPDIFVAINPRGTAFNYMTGSPTITVSSGSFTLSVAQTGNIGQGYVIIANSVEYYISLLSNSTTGNITTANGSVPGDVTGVSVTSIKPVWAEHLDAENGVNALIGSSDLVADGIVLHVMSYYDDDDFTPDTSIDNWNSLTTNATYRVIIEAPDGGTKSINNQRTTGAFDTNKHYFTASAGEQIRDSNGNMEFIGLQFRHTGNTNPSDINIKFTGNGGGLVDSCIIETPQEGNGILINATSGTYVIMRTAIYHVGTQGSASEGVYNTTTALLDLYYVLIRNQNDGLENDGGTTTATNSIFFDCANDIDGAVTVVNCATPLGEGSNAVTLDNGAYAYTSIWNDPNGTPEDYTPLNDTVDTNSPWGKGVDIPSIPTDMLGVAYNDPPNIGPYAAVGGGTPSATYNLVRNNSGSAELVHLVKNVAGVETEVNLIYNNAGVEESINTSGS